jgi:hypothetical protein
MFVIVLNQTNIVQDGSNNKLIYKFPNSVKFKDMYIAVSSIAMFYSWPSISASQSNNIFTYSWTSGVTTTTYTVLIPDGTYNISDINSYLQFVCINNGTYYINSASENVYPFELTVNVTRYAIGLTTYLIPTALPVGATAPANFVGLPTTACNSVVTFPSAFNVIVGYTAGFQSNGNVGNAYTPPTASVSTNYASKTSSGTLSYLSNLSPQVQPNSNVLFSMSNINNPYAQPSSIIYSLNPAGVSVGSLISDKPPNFTWNRLIDGTYNEIRLTLLGVDLKPLQINDPNMTIILSIRDKDEGYMASK